MIDNRHKHRERQRLAGYVPKPQGWYAFEGNPEQMGLHRMQNKNKKKKKF